MSGNFFGGQFFGGGFFGANTTTTVDTHDGVDWYRHEGEHKRDEEYKRRNDALKEAIRFALEGPKAEEFREELEALAEPQKTDSLYIPLEDRINVEALIARAELIIRIREEAARLALELDDEDVLYLL